VHNAATIQTTNQELKHEGLFSTYRGKLISFRDPRHSSEPNEQKQIGDRHQKQKKINPAETRQSRGSARAAFPNWDYTFRPHLCDHSSW